MQAESRRRAGSEVPLEGGHYAISSGRRWRTIIYPQLSEFIIEHDRTPRDVGKEDQRPSPATL
jgi:poly-beta-hydroxyalkanoate depolymerase